MSDRSNNPVIPATTTEQKMHADATLVRDTSDDSDARMMAGYVLMLLEEVAGWRSAACARNEDIQRLRAAVRAAIEPGGTV